MERRTSADIAAAYARLGLLPIGGGSGDGDANPPESGQPTGAPPDQSTPGFEAITSQEELDKRIGGRLARHEQELRKTITAEIAADLKRQADADKAKTDGDLQKQLELAQQDLAELKTKIGERDAELSRRDRQALVAEVARIHNLPEAIASRLHGETRDELIADAKALAKVVGKPAPVSTEAGAGRNPAKPNQSAPPYRFGASLPIVRFPEHAATKEGN
jgi:hypothetical protein